MSKKAAVVKGLRTSASKRSSAEVTVIYSKHPSKHFRTYIEAYFVGPNDPNETKANATMSAEWEAFKAEVGRKAALAAYWKWQEKLPFGQHSDCDPDGR